MTNSKKLAELLLEWGDAQARADTLAEQIKPVVLALRQTQTVGNVRATYSGGRKSYDYQQGAESLSPSDDIVALFTTPKTDWRKVCKQLGLLRKELSFTQSSPSVKLKLLVDPEFAEEFGI